MHPANATSPRAYDVAVVGGGVIGLTVARSLRRTGREVALIDPHPASGASQVAAGMLAPVTEVHFGETDLLALNLAAASTWPDFADSLTASTGHEIGYRTIGTVVVARDLDDRRELERLRTFAETLGLTMESLTSREVRGREPLLAADVRGGLWVPGDHCVDNRRLLFALQVACRESGVDFLNHEAAGLIVESGRVTGVRITGTESVSAESVVIAAGAWSGLLDGLRTDVAVPVRPVRGQVLRLHSGRGGLAETPSPRTTVRGLVAGRSVYIVPRSDGEVVVGATSDEVGFEPHVTAGSVWELLNDARSLLPSLSEMTFVEASAGLRPGTPDNVPLVGRTELPGLLLATGHYRNGILLAPLTAEHILSLLESGEDGTKTGANFAAWDPRRFRRAATPQLVSTGEIR